MRSHAILGLSFAERCEPFSSDDHPNKTAEHSLAFLFAQYPAAVYPNQSSITKRKRRQWPARVFDLGIASISKTADKDGALAFYRLSYD